ncbi:phage tail protein [Aureispira]|nr:phage tail protein [Aureispira sp.]
MDALSAIVDFLNEPIPSYFFEVLFLDDPFDAEDPLAMTKAAASLAIQVLDPVACAFTEVDGMEINLDTTTLKEAGWSSPRSHFTGMSYSDITLKRYLRPRHIGVMGFSLDPVSGWCQDTIQAAKTWEKKVVTKDLMIFIYHPMIQNPLPIGPAAFPIAGFIVQEAYPCKWSISTLSSTEDSSPVIETVSFKFTELQRLAVPPA